MNDFVKKIKAQKLKKSEFWLLVIIAIAWAPTLVSVLDGIVLRIPFLSDLLGENTMMFLAILSILMSLPLIRKTNTTFDILLYSSVLFVYVIQYLIFPENQEYLNKYFYKSMLVAVPMYFIGVSWNVERYDDLIFFVSILGIFWIGLSVLVLGSLAKKLHGLGDHYMAFSYELLILNLYTTFYLFRKFNWIGIFAIVIGVFCMITFGTRGPVVCYLLFVVFYWISFGGSKFRKRFLPVLVSFFVVFVTFFDEILLFLSSQINKYGMSSRLLDLYASGLFDDASTDERIQMIHRVSEVLVSGDKAAYGLFGSWNIVGNYTHRIYWDFWFNFGFVFGSILMALLVWIYYKAIIVSKQVEKGFILLLLCDSVVTMMFSDYYMFRGSFWMLLGFCLTRFKHDKPSPVLHY